MATSDADWRSALQLLGAADSPHSFEVGVSLVEQAVADGHAEAACMLSTIEAIGAGRPQNWNRAFRALKLASERGSEAAQAQLSLLGTAGIDNLLRPPSPLALSEAPRLRVFEGFASPEECRWIVNKLGPRLAPAMVWDEVGGMGRVDPARTSSALELRLPEMDVVTEVVRSRIAAATGLPEAIFEVPQVMRYQAGEEFRLHHDYLDPRQPGPAADIARRGQRMGTFLIYLNEDFEGGETEFPRAGIKYRGGTGDALFFANVTRDGQPDPLSVHAGRPPSRGEKWIFSQWIRDRVPGPG